MKKYLLVLLLVVFIVPSVALASWWNPFSWKIFHKKEVAPQVQVDVQKTPEEKIDELQKQLDELKNKEANTISPVIQNTPAKGENKNIKQQSTTQIIDVCLNIEGVQFQVPVGYSSVSGICTLVPVKDICPNIAGVQSTVPSGKFLYKNTMECLTEEELDAIDNLKSAKEAKERKELQCQDAKQTVVDLRKELLTMQTKHQTDYEEIMLNKNGALSGGLVSMVNNLDRAYLPQEDAMYAKISIAQAEVQLYCD